MAQNAAITINIDAKQPARQLPDIYGRDQYATTAHWRAGWRWRRY